MFNKLLFGLGLALLLCLGPNAALAGHDQDDEEHGQGHGHGHANGHEKHGDDVDSGRGHYRDHDRELHEWYHSHSDNLPPGLAKRDALPPGLERQLVVRGTLPPGLQERMRPCPREVEEYLPPAPAGYIHTFIGGNIVLVNRKTLFVLDVFHF